MKLEWIQAAIGCYWSADGFRIHTSTEVIDGKLALTFPQSGYVLSRTEENRRLGIFKTLRAAQNAAEVLSRGAK
jgi:hypothetical protein